MAEATESTVATVRAENRMQRSSAVRSPESWFSSSSLHFSSSAGNANTAVVDGSVRSIAAWQEEQWEEEAEEAVTWEQRRGKRTSPYCQIINNNRTEHR